MTSLDFFSRLGVFHIENFFDPEVCARLRAEVRSARGVSTTIYKGDLTYGVDEEGRRAKSKGVSDGTRLLVKERLLAVKPSLEAHFGTELCGIEGPDFLAYRPGDFFLAHRDSNADRDAPEALQARRVSVVVFLNGESEGRDAACYSGGSLTIFGLIDDPGWASKGFPLRGREGLLVAFRSELLHEVEPVTGGERHTVVSWFF
jgi:SM-20-related protein